MPSAKQIAARKAFVKKYAKKGKKGSAKNPPKKKTKKKSGLIPAFQVPIGYEIGDRKAQQRLMKRYITKSNKYQKEKMFRKWQGEIERGE